MKVVVDASVAIKWFDIEPNSKEAEKLLDGSYVLHAPELITPEFANIVWKKYRRQDLTASEARRIVSTFNSLEILKSSHNALVKAAYVGAELSGQTVYDWTYLTLAVSLSCKFVTADARFYKALENTTLKRNLLWIGDLA